MTKSVSLTILFTKQPLYSLKYAVFLRIWCMENKSIACLLCSRMYNQNSAYRMDDPLMESQEQLERLGHSRLLVVL